MYLYVLGKNTLHFKNGEKALLLHMCVEFYVASLIFEIYF